MGEAMGLSKSFKKSILFPFSRITYVDLVISDLMPQGQRSEFYKNKYPTQIIKTFSVTFVEPLKHR